MTTIMTATTADSKTLPQEPTPDGQTRRVHLPEQEQKLRLLEQQGRRIALLQADIEEKQQELETLKNDILTHWQPGEYETGTVTVKISEGARRLNERKFTQAFPPEEHPELYKPKPDMRTVKNRFAPIALTPYLTTGKSTVRVS